MSSTDRASNYSMKFPALYDATNQAAVDAQRAFLLATLVELSSLALAGGVGETPTHAFAGVGPVVALVLFAVALAIRFSGVGQRAEKEWYDGRAAAESIKSASWQYAVGGESYRLSDDDPRGRFAASLRGVLETLEHLDVAATPDGAAVTQEMQSVRDASLDERFDHYLSGRVNDQVRWYASKAAFNKSRAARSRIALLALESSACVLGVLRVADLFEVNWLGILATFAASVVAWIQVKKYSELSESYAVTSHEILLLAAAFAKPSDEEEWAQLVHDSEAAFSREHTLWLARRQGPTA